jgi:hypothetical protein
MSSPSVEYRTLLNLGPEWRSWTAHLRPCLEQHREWYNGRILNSLEPAYTLPVSVITALSTATEARGSGRASRRLISDADEQAERSFRQTCESYSPDTIGFWRDQPVQYSLLFPVEANLGLSEALVSVLMEGGTTKEQVRVSLAQAARTSAERRHQMLGYVGLLCQNEQFIAERDQLKVAFSTLPPHTALSQSSGGLLAPELSEALQSFYNGVRDLIQKWNLTGFATWDLPIPQGPLDSAPVGLISRLRGPQTRVTYVPPYYDVSSNVNLREEQRERQRREGQAAGVNLEFPLCDTSARRGESGRINPSSYETMFRIWLIHITVRRRYGRIRGAAARMDDALATDFGISPERIRHLRRQFAGSD